MHNAGPRREKEKKEKEISSTIAPVFFHGLFSQERNARTDFAILRSLCTLFLRVIILHSVCTSNDKLKSVCCCTLTMEIYIHVNCFYVACDFSILVASFRGRRLKYFQIPLSRYKIQYNRYLPRMNNIFPWRIIRRQYIYVSYSRDI